MLPVLLVLNSEKLAKFWSNTLSLLPTFAVRAPSLGLLPVLPLLKSEKLVLERHSITFA